MSEFLGRTRRVVGVAVALSFGGVACSSGDHHPRTVGGVDAATRHAVDVAHQAGYPKVFPGRDGNVKVRFGTCDVPAKASETSGGLAIIDRSNSDLNTGMVASGTNLVLRAAFENMPYRRLLALTDANDTGLGICLKTDPTVQHDVETLGE